MLQRSVRFLVKFIYEVTGYILPVATNFDAPCPNCKTGNADFDGKTCKWNCKSCGCNGTFLDVFHKFLYPGLKKCESDIIACLCMHTVRRDFIVEKIHNLGEILNWLYHIFSPPAPRRKRSSATQIGISKVKEWPSVSEAIVFELQKALLEDHIMRLSLKYLLDLDDEDILRWRLGKIQVRHINLLVYPVREDISQRLVALEIYEPNTGLLIRRLEDKHARNDQHIYLGVLEGSRRLTRRDRSANRRHSRSLIGGVKTSGPQVDG